MAQIVRYDAQQGLNSGSMPNTNIRNYVGEALAGLGGAVQDVAAAFQSQQQKKEDFKAEDGYRRLNMLYGQQMEEQAASMAEDGSGFHDAFMEKTYIPERDKFLSSLPERLREKYGTLLGNEGSVTTEWSIKAATKERDRLYDWYSSKVVENNNLVATAIAQDPDGYDAFLQQGIDYIDATGLPTDQKLKMKSDWERMAQISFLNTQLEKNPEGVLKDLGADPRFLTPTTQFTILKRALIEQESGGDPNAVSPKGAVGLMQVMPRTAVDISKALGDGLISKDMTDERIASIISNPVVNQRYGEYYLKDMIRQFAPRGGLEAALIAYNGGPARAKKWIESGFDDSVLPKETRDYYKKVIARIPTSQPGGGGKGDPSAVKFVFDRKGMAALSGQDENHLSRDLTNRVKSAFAAIGIDKVKITSGFRSATDNERVGGAKRSQHMHGNAVDIDVSGYSLAERVKIIEALSANGITGLGIGANIIHADIGGRRAWGYKTAAGGGEVPKWAQDVISKHLANTLSTPQNGIKLNGRFGNLPYADRQQFIAKADRQLASLAAAENRQNAVQRVELRTAMSNELASITATGQSTGGVDDTAVATILGEDDYLKWIREKERAQRTFAATDGVDRMSIEEMDQRVADFTPDPGSPTFADDQKVAAALQKRIDDVLRERARDPNKAALKYDDVAEAFAKISDDTNPNPDDVQQYVRLTLERQKDFNLKPGSEAPVPRVWAIEIGRALSRIPELGGRNANDVNAAILVQYDALEKVFGPYTDEVILYALSQYKGIGPNTGAVIKGYMEAIQAGGDPLRRIRERLDSGLDQDQIDSATQEPGVWSTFKSFFTGHPAEPDDPGEPEPTVERPVDNELVQRAITAIGSLDDLTPAEEASLVARYGEAAVAKAKSQLAK